MATLEQELMADFADSGDEQGEDDFADTDLAPNDNDEDQEMIDEEAEYEKKHKKAPSDIRGAQTLMSTLRPMLERISETEDSMEGVLDGESIEDSPEYQLLQEANEFSTQIDGEIQAVTKFVRDVYSLRFPYLEELIKNPVDYVKCVLVLQNKPLSDIKTIAQSADNELGVPLKEIISAASLMVVSVEATRSQGRDLTDTELEIVVEACKLLLELQKAKGALQNFVQSKMTLFAPNLTELLGSETAAQLISNSGGLVGLAKTPACNLAALGSNKASGLGLATNIGVRSQGFLYHSPILQMIRPDLRKQGMRIVSAKVVLAARVDQSFSSRDGSTGIQLKDDCERRLDKLTEVPKNSLGTRALPAPDGK
jgi:U4/U6 small nuclear ribonucleoprotein PRP31